nr:hypothetical protein [Tanacetum cinerariifolium]
MRLKENDTWDRGQGNMGCLRGVYWYCSGEGECTGEASVGVMGFGGKVGYGLLGFWVVAGVNTPRCDEARLELMELTVLLLPKAEKVRIRVSVVDLQVSAVRLMLLLLVLKFLLFGLTNWCCSLSAVRSSKGVECLPNEEIFAELARIGYEKPSTKLTFYKAFFSIQWKFLIHIILQCMSAKRTSWNEFSSSMTSAVICLSSGRKFNFSKYIFDNLVRNVDSPSKFYMYPHFLQLMIRKQVADLSTHTTKYTSPALTQKVFANMRRVGKGFSGVETSLFEGMLVDQQVEERDADKNVENVNAGDTAEGDVSAAHDEVPTKVGTEQRVETSDDTMMDDVSNQGRMIAEMDQDADVVLEEAKDVAADIAIDVQNAESVLSMQEDKSESAEVQEVVEVVTTAKLITEVVTAASTTITAAEVLVPAATTAAASTLIVAPRRRTKGVVIRDPEESTTTTSTIIHTEAKSKDNSKGILKAAKRKKLDEEVEELKRHLQIVPNEDDDVYTKATLLARKVLVVSYEIINQNNKPYYKIIRADGTHQLCISFLSLLRNFDREDLEALWSLVKERFATTKAKNFFDDFLLITLEAMFKKPDIHAQI